MQRELNIQLIEASKRGNLELAKRSIEEGADVNNDEVDVYQNRTPLHYASKYGYTELVKYLIDMGADVNKKARIH